VDASALIRRLEPLPAALPGLVGGLTADEARWKPPSGAWSILEVVNHLADEEVLDFRARLRSTLESPAAQWPQIDPEGWAVQRGYNQRDLVESVSRLLSERSTSLVWLGSLRDPDWSLAHAHPRFGPMSAGMLLASWAAHDALHIRQIAKRLYELAARDGEPHTVRYAGEWGP
jgi:hypothetical protein